MIKTKELFFFLFGLTYSMLAFSDGEFEQFQNLFERTIENREVILRMHDEIEEALSKDHILTGQELQTINLMALERFEQQAKSMDFINKNSEVTFQRISKNYSPDPSELKKLMMALALGVTMADNHLMVYKVFHTNNKVRRLLNEKDVSYDKSLNSIRDSIHTFYSFKNRTRLTRAISLFEDFYKPGLDPFDQDEFKTLSQIIEASPFYQKFKNRNFWGKVGDFFNQLGAKLFHFKLYATDIGAQLIEDIIFSSSKIFGNAVGSIKFRPGKLQKAENFLPTINSNLEVLDILMERTPARATSNFIPGFWTHAAIYVGGEEELKYYGVWDHPLVRKYHDKILKGANTIEGLRSGVEFNSNASFKDADSFSAIRIKNQLSYEDIQGHLLRAFAQIGKIYDFSFDIESGEKIVCSELHYITFIDVPFNSSRILGRQTISIDQVAEQALTGRYFDVVHFWLAGKEISKDKAARYDINLLTRGRAVLSPEETVLFYDLYDLEKGEIKVRKHSTFSAARKKSH